MAFEVRVPVTPAPAGRRRSSASEVADLPEPGFAHEPEGFAGGDGERDSVHDTLRAEGDGEVADFEQWFGSHGTKLTQVTGNGRVWRAAARAHSPCAAPAFTGSSLWTYTCAVPDLALG